MALASDVFVNTDITRKLIELILTTITAKLRHKGRGTGGGNRGMCPSPLFVKVKTCPFSGLNCPI